MRALPLLTLVAFLACEQAPAPAARAPAAGPAALLGAWSADKENFVWVIEADSILFEADMQRHAYTMAGDTLLIQRGEPIQKTRVVALHADSMIIQDVLSGTSETLFRLR